MNAVLKTEPIGLKNMQIKHGYQPNISDFEFIEFWNFEDKNFCFFPNFSKEFLVFSEKKTYV